MTSSQIAWIKAGLKRVHDDSLNQICVLEEGQSAKETSCDVA